MMKTYRVRWECEVQADDAGMAALEATIFRRLGDAMGITYDVFEDGSDQPALITLRGAEALDYPPRH